jgi:hypothetical protein
MSKVIPFHSLVRQQHLSFLKHKAREYRERQDYLLELRRLLFQVEAQLRQAEFQQLEIFQQIIEHFHIPLKFPDLGDRVGFQHLFNTDPVLAALQNMFTGKISLEDCLQRIIELHPDLVQPEE